MRIDLIEDLNRLMAEEAEASLRYFQMRFRVRGRGRAAAEKFFEEALKETSNTRRRCAADSRPRSHPDAAVHLSLDGGPMHADEALADALEVERQALDVPGIPPTRLGHPALEAFIRKQIDVETEHVREIQGSWTPRRR